MTCAIMSQAVNEVRSRPVKPIAIGNNLAGVVRRSLTIAEKQLGAVPIMAAAGGGASTLTGVYSIYDGLRNVSKSTDTEGLLIDGGLNALAGVANTGSGVSTVLTHSTVASFLGITTAQSILGAGSIYCGFVAFGLSLVNALAGLIESYRFCKGINSILENPNLSRNERTLQALQWVQSRLKPENIGQFKRQVGPKCAEHIQREGSEGLDLLIRSMQEAVNKNDPELLEYYHYEASQLLAVIDRANHQRNTSRVLLAIAAILGLVATSLILTGAGAALAVPILFIAVSAFRCAADIATINKAISDSTFQNTWAKKIATDGNLKVAFTPSKLLDERDEWVVWPPAHFPRGDAPEMEGPFVGGYEGLPVIIPAFFAKREALAMPLEREASAMPLEREASAVPLKREVSARSLEREDNDWVAVRFGWIKKAPSADGLLAE